MSQGLQKQRHVAVGKPEVAITNREHWVPRHEGKRLSKLGNLRTRRGRYNLVVVVLVHLTLEEDKSLEGFSSSSNGGSETPPPTVWPIKIVMETTRAPRLLDLCIHVMCQSCCLLACSLALQTKMGGLTLVDGLPLLVLGDSITCLEGTFPYLQVGCEKGILAFGQGVTELGSAIVQSELAYWSRIFCSPSACWGLTSIMLAGILHSQHATSLAALGKTWLEDQ
ncbi:hypothetical protein V8E55_002479 [Tylopilus felleus]